MEENICRLCLNFAKNKIEVLDAIIRHMLEFLLLKVDLEVCKNPILCQDCFALTKKCYFFKSTCLDTEDLILSFSAAKETVKIDIKDVYQVSKGVKIATDTDCNVCRFCMNQIKGNSVSIDILINDEMYVAMFPMFMPKMVLNIKDPVVCTTCKDILACYFKFIMKCLDIEEKINKYRQNEGSSMSQIRLSDVLGFLFKDVSTYPDKSAQITVIKQESLLEDVDKNSDIEMYDKEIKREALKIIKSKNSYKNASKVEMYKCELCTYETKYKGTLNRHVLMHKDTSEVEVYKCTYGICTYESKYKNSLKRHLLKHKDISEVKMHKCGICTYETKYINDLKRHTLIHKSEVEMYKCGSSYETDCKAGLETHMLVHKDSSGVEKHMVKHKDTSEVEMYKCETCTYETKYKDTLKRHLRIHKYVSEVEMYKCDICTYETRYKSYIKCHMLKHKDASEVEMYKCEICTYETKYKESLKRHMHIHKNSSEVEMRKCQICSYETKYNFTLKRHMLSHKHTSEVVMYKCDLCTYETKCKDTLQSHVLMHRATSEVET